MRMLVLLSLFGAVVLAGCGRTPGERTPQLENGSFSATNDGVLIRYEVHGSGPPLLVLTNSWGFDAAGVRALFRPLEERLTLVYFDPRGMGGSAPVREESDMGMETVRADLDAVRRDLGLERADVIGWSNGAMNLIEYAAEHPESVRRAVFVHGAASFGADDAERLAERYPDLMERYQQFVVRVQDPALDEAARTALQRELWLDEWFPLSTADPEAARRWIPELFQEAEFSYAHADYTNRTYPLFDARERLDRITSRCLVIAGRHDMLPLDKAVELHEGLSDAQLAVFEDSGHYAPFEEREKFVRTVWEFLGVAGR